jgi:hypothetical protein
VRRQTSNAKEPSELERRECVCDLYVCLFYAPEPAIRTVPVIELASMLLDELIAVDLLSWSCGWHTGERPYACHLYSSRFTRFDHLKAHVKTHSLEPSVSQLRDPREDTLDAYDRLSSRSHRKLIVTHDTFMKYVKP